MLAVCTHGGAGSWSEPRKRTLERCATGGVRRSLTQLSVLRANPIDIALTGIDQLPPAVEEVEFGPRPNGLRDGPIEGTVAPAGSSALVNDLNELRDELMGKLGPE